MTNVYVPKKMRRQVIKRAKGYCEYCYSHSSFSPSSFAIDHIFPRILGGLTVLMNLAFCCADCNGHKYQKNHFIDIITKSNVPLFHPRNDYWPDHFQWNEDETLIVGFTPTGRATAELLKVNRDGNVNLRNLLLMVGLHPPQGYIKN